MSQRNGDRSRFNRGRKAKIARRLRWRDAAKPADTRSAEPKAAKTRAAKPML